MISITIAVILIKTLHKMAKASSKRGRERSPKIKEAAAATAAANLAQS